MADNTPVSEIINEAVTDKSGIDPKKMSLEALILLLNTERLHQLEKKTMNEFDGLRQRQEQVRFLHQLQKAINASTNDQGEFDCTDNEELQKMMAKAKEKMDVDMQPEKTKYTKEERERLVENIKMTIDDLNVKNDMQLQTVTRLTNERYESYQMARSILKPLHDDKQNKARAIAGR